MGVEEDEEGGVGNCVVEASGFPDVGGGSKVMSVIKARVLWKTAKESRGDLEDAVE